MKNTNALKSIMILVLIAGVLSTNPTVAHETDHPTKNDPHKGLFLGLNAGCGNSAFGYQEGTRHIIDEGPDGSLGGLRFGYSFSGSFALSLEGFGFGTDDCQKNDEECGLGAGFLAFTWHPGSHGFFLRTGVGGGGGEFNHPESGDRVKLEERPAFLFSLGYDWRLNDSLTLGFSLDSMAIHADNTIGTGDDFIATSGASIQFNWYL